MKVKKFGVASLIIVIYLVLTYSYFYSFLTQKRLFPPAHETKTIFNNLDKLPIRYAALGDSLTEGVGVSDYEDSYPYLIAEKMALKNNVEVFNLSKAGATSFDVLINQIPQVETLNPDLITLLIGVNDLHNLKSLKEFEGNYTQITAALKKTSAKIYIFSIPYLGSNKIVFFPYNIILDFRTKQFNDLIKKIASNYKVEYIDLYSFNKDEDFYSIDQFHPSSQGYHQWARMLNVN